MNIQIDPALFTGDVNQDISFKIIKGIHKEVLASTEISERFIIVLLVHVMTNKEQVYTTTVQTDFKKVVESALAAKNTGEKEKQFYKRLAFSYTNDLKKKYFTLYKESHWGI